MLNKSVLALAFLAAALDGHMVWAKSPADPNKVLHVAYEAADDGFDMVKTDNYYSSGVSEVIFERLLDYDYLARPVKLRPEAAEDLPQIKDNGRIYIYKIKPHIYFSQDVAFQGKPRELTAQDFVYSYKRFLDPANHSPSVHFIEGKFVGADAVVEQAKKTGKFNYDTPIEGIKALDRYTLQFTLKEPDYNFAYVTAYGGFGAVAREVVDKYGAMIGMHPVGTGPYMLSKYVPRSSIELVANPDYRGFTWNFKSTGTVWDNQLVKDMTGKQMPQVGKVVISIIEEEQSRWLAFQDKQLDFDKLTSNAVPKVLDGDHLKPEFSEQGLGLYRNKEPEITYTLFNMRDPLLGGNSLDKIALRRAVAMSYNLNAEIQQLRKGQAVKDEMFVPDGVGGYSASYKNSIGYDPALANKLLDHFGYKKGVDGYRTMPDGKPLLLKITTESGTTSQIQSEIWKRSLDAVGIHVQFLVSNFADNMKAATQCKLMMWGGAWIADYPEGENFAQLLYGKNISQTNHSCYQSATYDALYDQMRRLPPEQRGPYYEKMNRQSEADTPWVLETSRIRNWLVRPWVKGFKAHQIIHSVWPYIDIPAQTAK